MSIRKTSLLLALILSLTAFSCGSEPQTPDETSSDETSASNELTETQPTEINRENAVIGLPKLDFGGETINILYAGENVYAQDVYAIYGGNGRRQLAQILPHRRHLAHVYEVARLYLL